MDYHLPRNPGRCCAGRTECLRKAVLASLDGSHRQDPATPKGYVHQISNIEAGVI